MPVLAVQVWRGRLLKTQVLVVRRVLRQAPAVRLMVVQQLPRGLTGVLAALLASSEAPAVRERLKLILGPRDREVWPPSQVVLGVQVLAPTQPLKPQPMVQSEVGSPSQAVVVVLEQRELSIPLRLVRVVWSTLSEVLQASELEPGTTVAAAT